MLPLPCVSAMSEAFQNDIFMSFNARRISERIASLAARGCPRAATFRSPVSPEFTLAGDCETTVESKSVVAEREGFEPSIRFCRILTFQASAFDHSATAPHARKADPLRTKCGAGKVAARNQRP